MIRKKRILNIVSNIKITSHNKKILNVCLRILKILQGRVRRIWINIHDPKIVIIVEERNKKNILVTNNVFVKWKSKKWKSDINIYDDSRGVIQWIGFSSKDKLIWVIWNAYQRKTFTVFWAGNWPNSCLRQFLDEDNIKIVVDFKDSVDNEIILSNILRKNLQVLHNHIVSLFMAEQIKFFQLFWILAYSLECYSLLNLCFQDGHSFESAW